MPISLFHRVRGKLWTCITVGALLASFVLPVIRLATPMPVAAASSTIVISEVLYDTTGTEPDEEWIEIYNLSASPVDLSDYKVGDEETQGGGEGMYQFPAETTIGAGQVIVIANRATAFYAVYGFNPNFELVESDTNIPNMVRYTTWASGSIELSNTSDEVLILDGSDNVVDALSWGSSTFAFDPPAPDVVEGHSLERYPANADTDSAGDFVDQATPAPGQVRTVAQGPRVVINEIMIDPAAVDDGVGEWFELYNAGGEDIDIQGWRIRSDAGLHTIGASLVIPVGGYVVLGNNGDSATNGGVAVDYVYSGITLDNAAGTLSLEYGDGQVADSVSYNTTDFLISPGASIQLIDPSLDNNVGANWRRAHTVWSGSAGDRGTPGEPNNADTDPPTVSSTSPAEGDTGVDVNANVTATFSEAMDETTVTADVFTLTADGTPVPGAFSYDASNNTLTFDPTDPLSEDTTYTARVDDSVMDLAGNRMAAPYTWSFTTATAPPPPLPKIVINEIMQNPAKVADDVGEWFELYNADDVAVDINGWTIRDNDTDSHVINNGGPLLIPAGGYLVLARNGDPATNGGLLADYVYSDFNLANGGDEVVLLDTSGQEVDRVEYDGGPNFPDPTGASMALLDPELDNSDGANWEESTRPYGLGDLGTPGQANFGPDTISPQVVFTRPAADATDVPLDSVVEAIFDEAMAAATFTADTFTLTGPEGRVDGTVVCEDAVATFTPAADLTPGTLYTASVSASVTDLAGNPLGADYTWSFTTEMEVGPEIITIAEAKTRELGSVVTVEGIATAPTGIYYAGSGNTKFYIQDATAGIQVYVPGSVGALPTVTLGDVVRITAELQEYRGEFQLVPAATEDWLITDGEPEDVPAPQAVAIADVGEDTEGLLITVQGQVTARQDLDYGNVLLTLSDGVATTDVYIDGNAGLDTSAIAVGDNYRFTGIGSQRDTHYRVMPRIQSDLVEIFPAPVLISEVQVRGPNGASDEFIELYNPSATDDFDLNGYRIDYQATTGTINSRYTWISPTIIPPHCHYLLVNSTGYSGTVPGDATYSAGLADNGALAIVRVADGSVIDSVGWGTISTSFVETSPATAPASGESIERKPGGDEGNGQDTNNNSVDFQVISPPNPQNLASPPVPPIGPPFVPIYEIQGDGFISPYDGQQVTTAGVVIADFQDTGKNGFFIQDVAGDGNSLTSDGIFVYEGSNSVDVALGDAVTVIGTVDEYYSNTQIVLQTVTVDSSDNPLPVPVELNPPFDNMEALAYYEALEGMLVSAPQCVVVGPTNQYGEFVVVRADLGIERVFQDDPAGTGERIMVDDEGGLRYYVKVGDSVEGLIGPLDYTFDNYKVQQRDALTITAAPDPGVPAPPDLAADEFSVVTFNLENLFDTVDEPEKDDPVLTPEEYELKLTKLAAAINALGAPTILAVQEAENAAVLADLAARTVVSYQVTLVDGPDARGIDVGLLTRSDRVTVLSAEARQACTTLEDGFGPGQGDCPEGQNMLFSRPPLVANLTVDGFPLTVIVNHFKSKSQDTPEQQVTLPRRIEQAQWVANLVDEVLAADPQADVIVLGDLNDFLDSEPLAVLTGAGLRDVLLDVEKPSRYTYIYTGESEVLDHVLISADLEMEFQGVMPFHINADFPVPEVEDDTLRKSSDHDPVLTWFRLAPAMAAFTAEPIYAQVGEEVVFTNQSTGTEPLTVLWDFDDGATSTDANPVHAYAAEGDYTVTLTVTNAWGSDQASVVIHVGRAPEAAFSYSPKSPWVGQKVKFTNESRGTEPLSYEWDFGDGGSSTVTNPQHVYMKAGTYRVRLTATNPWGSDTASAEIVVSHPPLSLDVRSMFIRWMGWGGRNFFVTSGKLKLPSGYSRDDLQDEMVVAMKIGGKTASEEVVFRKCGKLWFAIRRGGPDGSLDVGWMVIYWKPGHSDRKAEFGIVGTAELPGVGAGTEPPKVTLEFRWPLRDGGKLTGHDTVTCAVHHQWWIFPR
ncbi:MAG: lamin tail domain-containing protein [Anaerolineae bacterium]|nr:lamin tail domain-containing protein [Anaerolineae bacterium]